LRTRVEMRSSSTTILLLTKLSILEVKSPVFDNRMKMQINKRCE
jgi:hypothetical protein